MSVKSQIIGKSFWFGGEVEVERDGMSADEVVRGGTSGGLSFHGVEQISGCGV